MITLLALTLDGCILALRAVVLIQDAVGDKG